MSLCLYAIVALPVPPLRLRGVRGETLTTVGVQGLGGVVGEQRSPLKPTARNLRAYHDLVTTLALRVPALLPVRFGTVVQDDELAFILTSRSRFLTRALTAVRRRAQMTVRVVRVQDATPTLRDSVHREADRSSGVAFLRSRAAVHHRAAQYPECVALRRRVGRWVRGERVEERGGIVSIYHLVPRSAAEPYRRAISDAAGRLAVHVQVSGPFPPFAFAEMGEAPRLRRGPRADERDS